jgi:putative effector of murein hydrolase LrgA (UPF0299 family)
MLGKQNPAVLLTAMAIAILITGMIIAVLTSYTMPGRVLCMLCMFSMFLIKHTQRTQMYTSKKPGYWL